MERVEVKRTFTEKDLSKLVLCSRRIIFNRTSNRFVEKDILRVGTSGGMGGRRKLCVSIGFF